MFKPKAHAIPVPPPASVAIQGQAGSFSHMACSALFNEAAIDSFDTFEEAFDAVVTGKSALGVIPVQNTIADKVPYVHGLIRSKGLHMIGEYFLPIEHCILTLPKVRLVNVTTIHSHMHALAQCRGYLSRHMNFITRQNADTAGAAKMISELDDPTQAAISPALAAQIYGLLINQRGIQDSKNNITRFLVFAREPVTYEKENGKHYITPIILKPKRKQEWALFEITRILKEHGIRHSSLHEYQGTDFRNEGYFFELIGHPDERRIKRAIYDLRALSSELSVVGSYPTHHFHRFRGHATPPTPAIAHTPEAES